MTTHIPNASKQRNILSKRKIPSPQQEVFLPVCNQKRTMTFSLSYLTKLSPTLILREPALGSDAEWTFFDFTTPVGPKPPHLSGRTWCGRSMRGRAPGRAGSKVHTAVSSPPPSPHCQERGSQPAPGITGSHCPIPSFLGWAADTSLSFTGSFTPWNRPGSSGKVRGAGSWAVAVRVVQCRAVRGPGLVCLYLSAFSIAADGAPHVINNTKKKSLDLVSLFAINYHDYALSSLFFC